MYALDPDLDSYLENGAFSLPIMNAVPKNYWTAPWVKPVLRKNSVQLLNILTKEPRSEGARMNLMQAVNAVDSLGQSTLHVPKPFPVTFFWLRNKCSWHVLQRCSLSLRCCVRLVLKLMAWTIHPKVIFFLFLLFFFVGDLDLEIGFEKIRLCELRG